MNRFVPDLICNTAVTEQKLYEYAVISHYVSNRKCDFCKLYEDEVLRITRNLDNENGYDCGENLLSEPHVCYGKSLFDLDYDFPFPAPADHKFTFIDLFAGIGGFRIAMQEVGGKCVYSSEFNHAAQQTYYSNFGEVPFGDITLERNRNFIPQKFDVLCAGFPCQAFSIIGKRKGFSDTRGTMFFEIQKIIEQHFPPVLFMENVKQLVSHDSGRTFKTILGILDDLGYVVKWKVLNAMDFGVPQKRERVIILGFRDSEKAKAFNFDFEKKPYSLKDILEKDEHVDKKLYVSDHILKKREERTVDKQKFYPSIWHENKAGNISILDYACALRTGASYNYLLVNGYRRPSSRELLRIQGFPEKFKIVVSHQEIRKQTGNSVAVPMMIEIARKISKLL